jgi:hypothetical protein
VAQLRQRPRRSLWSRTVRRQVGGKLQKRARSQRNRPQIGHRHPGIAQLRRGHTESPRKHARMKTQAHERFSLAGADGRGGVRAGHHEVAVHPHQVHAPVRKHPHRLRGTVHHPRAFEQVAQRGGRREFAIAHACEATSRSATPDRRSWFPPRRADA